MITILIDGYALSDGSQVRGVGTYLRRLISGLADAPELTVKVLAEPSARLPETVERVPIRRRLPPRLRPWEHDLLIPIELRGHRADVFHSPAQHPPRRSAVPWVQTLHDLIPLTRPHPLLERDRRRWVRIGPRLRRAAAIVTPSRFSAEEAIRHLGLEPSRLHVIPHGVDPAVFHPGERSGSEPPYLLHVGAWGPHKGLHEAQEVVGRLAAAGHPHRLLVVGPHDPWMLGQARAAVAGGPCPERVDLAGFVDDLPGAYRGAAALLATSRCEGFGLPALEAMACGTPVVAFDNSALPEVVGDGGVLVADGDSAAMAASVIELLGDRRRSEELSARAAARARAFTWEATIAQHLELLRAVAR